MSCNKRTDVDHYNNNIVLPQGQLFSCFLSANGHVLQYQLDFTQVHKNSIQTTYAFKVSYLGIRLIGAMQNMLSLAQRACNIQNQKQTTFSKLS